MASSKVAFLIGGGNLASVCISKLESLGYTVALASRNPEKKDLPKSVKKYSVDLEQPESALTVYNKVVKEVGIPSVVLYTAYSTTFTSFEDQSDFLTPAVADFAKTLNVNVASVYAVLQAFTKHGASFPKDVSKSFIVVGNPFNDQPMLPVLALGVGKSGSANLMHAGSISPLTKDGFRFYYIDERTDDNKTPGAQIALDAHATVIEKLIKQKGQGHWQVVFRKNGEIQAKGTF